MVVSSSASERSRRCIAASWSYRNFKNTTKSSPSNSKEYIGIHHEEGPCLTKVRQTYCMLKVDHLALTSIVLYISKASWRNLQTERETKAKASATCTLLTNAICFRSLRQILQACHRLKNSIGSYQYFDLALVVTLWFFHFETSKIAFLQGSMRELRRYKPQVVWGMGSKDTEKLSISLFCCFKNMTISTKQQCAIVSIP